MLHLGFQKQVLVTITLPGVGEGVHLIAKAQPHAATGPHEDVAPKHEKAWWPRPTQGGVMRDEPERIYTV